jgi:hypothetical protein
MKAKEKPWKSRASTKAITTTPAPTETDWAAREVNYLTGKVAPTIEALTEKVNAIKNGNGVAFTAWVHQHADMFKQLSQYAQEELSTEPGALAADLTGGGAWLSFANARLAEAESYEDRALALARMAARQFLGDHAAGDLARAACWKIVDARRQWKAVAGSLNEKVWSARALLKPFDMEKKLPK